MTKIIRGTVFRVLRVTLLALTLLFAGSWLREHLGSLASEQAVINAEMHQIRTPIGGQLELADVRPGSFLRKGDVLLKVKNVRFGEQSSAAQAHTTETYVQTLRNEALGARYTEEVEAVTCEQSRRLFKMGAVARLEWVKAESRLAMAKELTKAKDAQLADATKRAAEAAAQASLQRESIITMPHDGVVWSVAGKAGEQVEANHVIMEIINPAKVWIDAFFAERHTGELQPGQQVVVRTLDGTAHWTGVLRSVRAGVGRMAIDSTVAVPPPAMLKRQIAARVDAEFSGRFDPSGFCGVGRSVHVSFPRAETAALNFPATIRAQWRRIVRSDAAVAANR